MAKKTAPKKPAYHVPKVVIPEGYEIIPLSDMEEAFKFTEENPYIEGEIQGIKTVTIKRGKKMEDARIMGIKTAEGKLCGVWESAKLARLFDMVESDLKKKTPQFSEVFIHFTGLIEMGKGKQPMRDFEVGLR